MAEKALRRIEPPITESALIASADFQIFIFASSRYHCRSAAARLIFTDTPMIRFLRRWPADY